jgi:hypothetical protein
MQKALSNLLIPGAALLLAPFVPSFPASSFPASSSSEFRSHFLIFLSFALHAAVFKIELFNLYAT